MKRTFTLFINLLFTFSLFAQYIPEDVANTAIYEFLDEMASEQYIQINSAVRPYSKMFISEKLSELYNKKELLNDRQKKELFFFLKGYSLERDELPSETYWNLVKNNHVSLAVIPPTFYYKDSLFRAKINPVLGVSVQTNKNGTLYQRYWGAEFQGMVGEHFAIYGSLRDNHLHNEILVEPSYLVTGTGGAYKRDNEGKNADFSEMRGGITYAWKWGNMGLIKNHVIWGDNNHGSNILSGKTPSFPMIVFNIKPVKWFELNYFHGFLTSNVLDSTDYYIGNDGEKRFRYRNKYIAANMLTFTPIKNLNIGLGNSVIYAERTVKAGYLIPIMFFKSIDHSSTMGSENQNSQMYLNISSRNIRHLHLYFSLFVDELSVKRFFNEEHNFISYKVGATLSNFPLQNFSLTGEVTYTDPVTYKHRVLNTTFESNGYNLGHYLRDNSREFYFAITYKPVSTLQLTASYTNAIHGNEYAYIDGKNPVKTPVLQDKTWSNNTFSLQTRYLFLTNLYASIGIQFSDINTYDIKSSVEYDEERLTAEECMNLFTPAFYQGKTITLNWSLNYYF